MPTCGGHAPRQSAALPYPWGRSGSGSSRPAACGVSGAGVALPSAPMDFTDLLLGDYEQIEVLRDERAGVLAFVAIHDTRLGPAFGGIRRLAYRRPVDALADALRLAAAMTWKCAAADVPGGGGKTVLWWRPDTDREAAYRTIGRFVEELGGRYFTGPDVGTETADLAVVAEETGHVAVPAEIGNLAEPTALGVFAGIEAVAERLGFASLDGVHVLVQGLGEVGSRLAEMLAGAGARLTVTDVREAPCEAVRRRCGATVVEPGGLLGIEADVFAPCALGGVGTRPQRREPQSARHRRLREQRAGPARARPGAVRARRPLRARLRDQLRGAAARRPAPSRGSVAAGREDPPHRGPRRRDPRRVTIAGSATGGRRRASGARARRGGAARAFPASVQEQEGQVSEARFRHRIRVRYCETDRMGVAHHGSYVDWFEEARTEWMRAQGETYRELEDRGVLLQIVDLQIRYKSPLDYDDEMWIEVRVGTRRRVTIELCYEARRADDDRLVATGSTTLACVDRGGRLRRLPAGMLAPTAGDDPT